MGRQFATQRASLRAGRRAPAQTMVEFSMVVLLLVGVITAMFEGARWVVTYFVLADAASQATRAGSYVPTTSWTVSEVDDDVKEAARSVLPPWITLPDDEITICRAQSTATSCTAPGETTILSGYVIEVTITHTFQWLPFAVGWLGTHSDTITAYHRQRID
jgi:Flp pilus assembly protein TadG